MIKQGNIKQIARQRIEVLFREAEKIAKADPQLAAQYVCSARRIAMAAKIQLPIEFRRRTCKVCNAVFVHGVSCRVRVKQKREPHVVVTCLNCGNQTRYILKKKVQTKVE
ncbi:MAG: ribonuclease P [Candidatus Bathyarchaeota archaeon]|nr:ribonuclease P [Candidatus Bathyarchaeota archaeon]